MKITIEPTMDQAGHNTVTIESHDDHLGLEEVVEIMQSAIRAWGFTYANLEYSTNESL